MATEDVTSPLEDEDGQSEEFDFSSLQRDKKELDQFDSQIVQVKERKAHRKKEDAKDDELLRELFKKRKPVQKRLKKGMKAVLGDMKDAPTVAVPREELRSGIMKVLRNSPHTKLKTKQVFEAVNEELGASNTAVQQELKKMEAANLVEVGKEGSSNVWTLKAEMEDEDESADTVGGEEE